MAKAKPKQNKSEFPISIETFSKPCSYDMLNLKRDKLSCVNGCVEIRKYRITFEEIEEPHDVLCSRLQELWDECDNHHHVAPLRAEAKRLGYVFVGEYGNAAKK